MKPRHVTREALAMCFTPEAAALLGAFAQATTRPNRPQKNFPSCPTGTDVTDPRATSQAPERPTRLRPSNPIAK